MRYNYQFSNLIGSVYSHGNVKFSDNGSELYCPVGNKLNVTNLKNGNEIALETDLARNITVIEISPNGLIMIIVDEEGKAVLFGIKSGKVISKYSFIRNVKTVKFSPDSQHVAVCRDNDILIYYTPLCKRTYCTFTLMKTIRKSSAMINHLSWSSDSTCLVASYCDMTARVCKLQNSKIFETFSLLGYSGDVLASFFEKDDMTIYSVSKERELFIWDCNYSAAEVSSESVKKDKFNYKRRLKYNYGECRVEANLPRVQVSSAHYNSLKKLFFCGFLDGTFFIHEMPDFILVHSLSLSENMPITNILSDNKGLLVAITTKTTNSGSNGQVVVWEWQSETYVLKKQGHAGGAPNSVAYSPNGEYLATGGHDGKLKLWTVLQGQCFVTFDQHTSCITDVSFTPNSNAVVSCSMDGTVRAYDLLRYRNFRTMTTPEKTQLCCLTIDKSATSTSSQIIAAGSYETFKVYVWSLQTGHILQVISGHTGPVVSVCFTSSSIVSGSWDGTFQVCGLYSSQGATNSIEMKNEVISVKVSPDDEILAVSTLKAQIHLYDTRGMDEFGVIYGKSDLGYTKNDSSKISAKKASSTRAFSCMSFSTDNKAILAAGSSKYVCMYSVQDQMLIKRFVISENISLDGMMEHVDRRTKYQWWKLKYSVNSTIASSLTEQAEETKSVALPGVKFGDKSSRTWHPEICVNSISFCPTGRNWTAASTEGICIFSIDNKDAFDPLQLSSTLTVASTLEKLKNGEFAASLMMSLRLNELYLITDVLEAIPLKNG